MDSSSLHPEISSNSPTIVGDANPKTGFFSLKPDGSSKLGFRFLIVGLTIACIVGLFSPWGLGGPDSNAPKYPLGLESTSPVAGALTVPGQFPLVVDLQFGFVGELTINDTFIPADQLTFDKARGLLTFSPGPGKEFEILPGSINKATVVFWPEISSKDASGRSYSWTFTVN